MHGYTGKKPARLCACLKMPCPRRLQGNCLSEEFEKQTAEIDETQQQTLRQLRSGNVFQLLAHYSIPAVIATTTASIYNIIDRIFIGHGVGAMAIAGLALTLPMMNMGAALGSLVGGGGGTLVSIRLGQKRYDEASQIFGNTIFLNLVLGIGYAIVCSWLLDPLLRLIGASNATLPYAHEFMQIILLGNVFTHLYLGLNNLTRASGYPRRAMSNTLQTVAVNCVLAPIFIFGLHWGIRGAALATVLAQFSGAVVAFPHFLERESTVRFYLHNMRPRWSAIRGIFSIGISNFVMMFCASITAMLFNMRMARYGGDYAVGAFGIANTLIMFFVMISFGINQGMQPIAGYNFGARQFGRVKEVFRYAVMASSCTMLCGFLLAEVVPGLVVSIFTGDAEMIRQTTYGLRMIVLLFPLDGLQMTTSVFFQSIGKARISLLLALSRQVIYLIPFLIVLPLCWGLRGVWLAEPFADTAAFLTTALVLRMQLRSMEKTMAVA